MLKLYTARNSICTQKVLITLAEKSIPYTTQEIDLFGNEQYRPEYLRVNPKGVVPALVHDDHIVTESTLICEYLDDTVPSPRLIPTDPYSRAAMRKWSKAVDEGLFEATRELSFSAMFRDRMRGMTEAQREGRFRNVGDPNKRARFMSTYELGVESPYVFQAVAAFEVAFREMERTLAANADSGWLVGPSMTLADVNMMPFVARLAYLDLLEVWIAERPGVQRWWERVQFVSSFRASVSDLMTPADRSAMSTSGARIKPRVAGRREEYLALTAERPAALA